jgi:hypothetical protein
MRELPFYLLAILLGLGTGFVEIRLNDLLVTALLVLVSTLVLGFVRTERPWRWTVVVGACVPLVRLWSYVALGEHAYRAQMWESGLAFLTGIAGAYCGYFSRKAITELFRPNRETQK